jgi:hypothetical protein
MDTKEIMKLIDARGVQITSAIAQIEKLSIECVEIVYKAAYNQAIEDAIKTIEADGWSGPALHKIKGFKK